MPRRYKVFNTPRYKLSEEVVNVANIETLSIFIFNSEKELSDARHAIRSYIHQYNKKVVEELKLSIENDPNDIISIDNNNFYLIVKEEVLIKTGVYKLNEGLRILDSSTLQKIKNEVQRGKSKHGKSLKEHIETMLEQSVLQVQPDILFEYNNYELEQILINNNEDYQTNNIVTPTYIISEAEEFQDNNISLDNQPNKDRIVKTRYKLPSSLCGIEGSEKISLMLCKDEKKQKQIYRKYRNAFKDNNKKFSYENSVTRWIYGNNYYVMIREDQFELLHCNPKIFGNCKELSNGDVILENFKNAIDSNSLFKLNRKTQAKLLKNSLKEIISLRANNSSKTNKRSVTNQIMQNEQNNTDIISLPNNTLNLLQIYNEVSINSDQVEEHRLLNTEYALNQIFLDNIPNEERIEQIFENYINKVSEEQLSNMFVESSQNNDIEAQENVTLQNDRFNQLITQAHSEESSFVDNAYEIDESSENHNIPNNNFELLVLQSRNNQQINKRKVDDDVNDNKWVSKIQKSQQDNFPRQTNRNLESSSHSLWKS